MTKYFVDDAGCYLGAFDGAEPPAGSVEVPSAPSDARQLWAGGAWGAVPVAPVTHITAVQGLKAIDHFGLSAEYELWANDPARTFLQRTFINREPVWRRDDATLNAAATHLGLTSTQVAAMFEWADAA